MKRHCTTVNHYELMKTRRIHEATAHGEDSSTNFEDTIGNEDEDEEMQVMLEQRGKAISTAELKLTSTPYDTPSSSSFSSLHCELPKNIDYNAKVESEDMTIIGQPNPDSETRGPYGAVFNAADGCIYFADFENNCVVIYGIDGRDERIFCTIPQPLDIAIHNEKIFVLQPQTICVFDKEGTMLKVISASDGPSRLKSAMAIEIHHGHLVVLDEGNKSVILFNEDGQYQRSINCWCSPWRLAIDDQSRIYVSDQVSEENKRECVRICDWEGNLLGEFTTDLFIPDVCVDGDGYISVASWDEILVYDRNYELCHRIRIPDGGDAWIDRIRLMPDGRFIVSDYGRKRICLV